jgi:glycosyltransferase involved in cell wall biosynthesis
MRLLLSSYFYPPSIGGVELQSHLLARSMVKRGHAVRVVSARLPGFRPHEDVDGVHICRVSPGHGSRWQKMVTYLAGMLAETIRWSHWADIIHVQQVLYPAAAVAMLAPFLRRPLVVGNTGSGIFGGVQLMRRVPFGRFSLRLIANNATGVSLNAEMTAEMREAGFRRLVVIPSGVEFPARVTSQGHHDARVHLGVDGPIVLYVGRLDAEKGVDLLIDAWHLLQSPDATLLLVGDGPERQKLEQLATSGVNRTPIRFEGPSTDVHRYYAAADVFVLPSRSEGLSNALLEAMASGLPVVATDVGGNRQVIDTPLIGKLVAPSDPRSLRDAIAQLLANPAMRRAMGQSARAHVQAAYSIEGMLDCYERLYRTLRPDAF